MRRRAATAVIAVAAVVAALTATAPSSGATAQTASPAAAVPQHWDKRIKPYADFVEKHRKLDFDHPVKVRFLSDTAFEKELRSDDATTSAKDREVEEQVAGELLALGLAGQKFDLGDASEDLDAADVVGYYDPEGEDLVVRGTDLSSAEAKVTVVHELTHALQDQHFDLDKLYDGATQGSESYALDFLIEGDATVVESAYLDTLSQAEQDEYYGANDEVTSAPLPEGVPYALDIIDSAPYVLGEAFVHALDPKGGTSGRDRAFHTPPKTEEVLIDPVALAHHETAKKVPDPEVGAGEKKVYDPEQFGVISLYLMLATRLDPRVALEAVTGWGGDRYVGFRRDDSACVRANVTGDTRRDTDELESALTAWGAAMPAGAVTVSRSGAIVTFVACEAAGVTAPTTETFDRAFYNVLGGRVYTVLDIESQGVPPAAARCVGDAVSTDPPVVALYDALFAEGRDPTEAELALVDDSYSRALPACGLEA